MKWNLADRGGFAVASAPSMDYVYVSTVRASALRAGMVMHDWNKL